MLSPSTPHFRSIAGLQLSTSINNTYVRLCKLLISLCICRATASLQSNTSTNSVQGGFRIQLQRCRKGLSRHVCPGDEKMHVKCVGVDPAPQIVAVHTTQASPDLNVFGIVARFSGVTEAIPT